ncbi:hypothetical protein D6833_13760, partial [Candidatus Parcubacteria bacterium]
MRLTGRQRATFAVFGNKICAPGAHLERSKLLHEIQVPPGHRSPLEYGQKSRLKRGLQKYRFGQCVRKCFVAVDIGFL